MTYRRPYTFDRVARIFFSACAIIAILFILNTLKGVLLPFLVACLIAYILEPLVIWNKNLFKSKGRALPVIVTLIEITVAFVGISVLLVPYIIGEAARMGSMLKSYAVTTMETPYLPDEVHDFIKDNLDINSIVALLAPSEWKEIISKAVSSGWSFLSSSLSFIFGLCSWLIVFLYVAFIMFDYEKLTRGFKNMIPRIHRKKVLGVLDDVRMAMHNYFRGQFFVAMTVGVLFAIGFAIIGLPMGVVLGLFIGVLNMVPYLQLISFPLTAFLCLVSSVDTGIDFWVIFWECMAVYVVVQLIQDLYLSPKIMGKAMGLNPAIILLSLSVWGSLLGFLGLIIALPLTSLLLSYYNRYVVEPYRLEEQRERAAADNKNDDSKGESPTP